MKILQLVILTIIISCFSQSILAQACCPFSFNIFIKDAEGNFIQNAKIELSGRKSRFDPQTKLYREWYLMGVNTSFDTLLKVKANGFQKFETDIVVTCGQFNYELHLKRKKTDEKAVFEELSKISGVLTDTNGENIPNVRVVLTSKDGLKKETLSNENGYYSFIIKSGIYTLEFAENSEFVPNKTEEIELEKGHKNLDITLMNKEEN